MGTVAFDGGGVEEGENEYFSIAARGEKRCMNEPPTTSALNAARFVLDVILDLLFLPTRFRCGDGEQEQVANGMSGYLFNFSKES